MFSSATIMWIVDCAFAKFNGEDFFDISYDDTLLGITVVFLAIILDIILRLPKIAQNQYLRTTSSRQDLYYKGGLSPPLFYLVFFA